MHISKLVLRTLEKQTIELKVYMYTEYITIFLQKRKAEAKGAFVTFIECRGWYYIRTF